MSTATLDIEIDEQPVPFAPPEASTLFMARRSELRLIKVARQPTFDGAGRKMGESRGECVAFVEGTFRCPHSGMVRIESDVEVDAAELLEWLGRHPRLGNVNEGFWIAPQAAPPVSEAEIQALVDAVYAPDGEEVLERVLAEERGGWQRQEIIRVADRALERVRTINEGLARADAAVDEQLAGRVKAIEERERELAERAAQLEARAEEVAEADRLATEAADAAVELADGSDDAAPEAS